MKIDLAAMIRRAGTVRTPYVLPRTIEPTRAQQTDLQAIYMRVVRGWLAIAEGKLLPEYGRTLPGLRDSVDDVTGEAETAAAAMTRLTIALSADLEDWVVRVETWHRTQFASIFTPSGVRIDTLLGAGDVRATLQAVLQENIALIRSIDDQLKNGISGAVFRGLQARTPARDVAREIRKLAGIGKRRAELIAADQLQKLSSRLDQERQEQVGATKFRWRHSRKKYPRLEHVERDGKTYEWKSRVGREDPPGRAIRCGCRAQPIIELDTADG